MAHTTLKPKTNRSTLLLCTIGGAFAVVATVALVGVVFTGSDLLGGVGAFAAVAALGCLFVAFLPPGTVEELVASLAERYQASESYHGDDDDYWRRRWYFDPAFSDHPSNIWYDPDD